MEAAKGLHAEGEKGVTMRILGVIPARGGSRGIPRKNIRDFCGRPLLEWTIEAALASGVLDRLAVSTDDEEIAAAAVAAGAEVPCLRPADLAGDDSGTEHAVRHLLDTLSPAGSRVPDVVIVLEPTSPARRAFHIKEAAEKFHDESVDSVASVSPVPHHYLPGKILEIDSEGALSGIGGVHPGEMIHRRQELRAFYAFNGLVFSCRSRVLLEDPPTLWGGKVRAMITNPKYSIDLDEPEDWLPGELRMRDILEEENE